MEKIIEIPNKISDYIEGLQFEYNQYMNILKYLMSCDTIKKEYLDSYFEQSKNKGIELEYAKEQVIQKYVGKCPQCYCFDFLNNTIKIKVDD